MIKLKGHSEFYIKIIKINNKYLIQKSSSEKNFNRLKKQIEKQINLYNNNFLLPNIKIPRIINSLKYSFTMEYIYDSENIIDFIIKNNVFKYKWFTDKLILIIELYIKQCNFGYINKKILSNKIDNVIINIKNNKNICIDKTLNDIFQYLKDNIHKMCQIKFPLGICHGDLTLSNILIDTNYLNLYLIDFLDSFIESPILDIVKIRQDTKYLWSLNMYEFKYDINKTIIILNHIDTIIDNFFKKYDFYVKGYKYLQILNLLRVLQYSKDKIISDKLILNLNNCKNI